MAASSKPTKIIVIQGATASGKTGLAIELAKRFSGEIVNADSLQMVRGFDIGTAKPTLSERSQAAHHLIDVVEPDEPLDVARFVEMAAGCIRNLEKSGKLSIIAGGTGLYVRALLGGLVDLPGRNDVLRAKYEKTLEECGAEALFATLAAQAPEAEQHVDRRNPRRVIRALEVLELTGKPIWQWQDEHRFAEKPYRALRFAIDASTEWLRPRVEQRTRQMLENGLIEEVRSLLRRFPDAAPKAFEAIGYRQVLAVINGEAAESELASAIATATVRYARKQRMWLRKEHDIKWIAPGELDSVVATTADFLSR